jgi:outer membrane immunogenic protein
MKKAIVGIVALVSATLATLIETPVFAAAPAPVPYSWTGFYAGIAFGAGWSGQAVNFSPNDTAAALLLSSGGFFRDEQPVAGGYRVSQSGAVGGFAAGYDWLAGSNWLLGLETDFSFSGMSGQATGPTSLLLTSFNVTQSTAATQSTDWYGTVRGRAGWLATPNLLLFGAGGFAYGRSNASATYTESGLDFGVVAPGGSSLMCMSGIPCFAGSTSTVRTGWTAGGGVEWLLDRHWSAKIEYQFVDLGTQTVRATALVPNTGDSASSFNAAIRDQFNVVRVGLNYRF